MNKAQVYFTKILRVLSITFLLVFVSQFVFVSNAVAATGINKQINFQGKVVNKTVGTNVANGSYDFVFKIYDAASSGTLIWTEKFDAANGNALTVTDGIFRTALGSVCVFAGGSCQSTTNTAVDFNTDNLYLDITFNGETMGSRIQLSAVPYALNADKVHGLTVTDTTGTLTIANSKTFTVSNTLTLAGTDGTSFTLPSTGGGTVLVNNISGQSIAGSFSLTGTSGDLTLAGTTGLTFSGTGGQINFTLGETIDNDTDGVLKFTAPHASLSGTLTVGQGQTIRPEYGPLQLAYKSGANAWTNGLILQDTTGYIGIGTANPTQMLDVSAAMGNGTIPFLASTVSDTTRGFRVTSGIISTAGYDVGGLWATTAAPTTANAALLADNSGNTYFNAASGQGIYYQIGNANKMQLTANGGLSLGATYYSTDPGAGNMIIQGSLGIGTTGPISELHVTRPLSFGTTGKALAIFDQIEDQDIFTASKSGITKFIIDQNGGASMSGTLTIGQGQSIRSEYGPLQLAYKSGGDVWTTGITIQDTTGNVGIGTTAPVDALEVANGGLTFSSTTLGNNGSVNVTINAGTTGTTATLLVKLDTSGNVVTTSTSVLNNAVGVALDTKSSGQAVRVATQGVVTVTADNTVTAGDYIGLGTTTGGRTKSLGTTYPSTSGIQVIGRAISGASAGSTFLLMLGSLDNNVSSAGSGGGEAQIIFFSNAEAVAF